MSLSEPVSVAEFFYTYVLQPQQHTEVAIPSIKTTITAQVSEPTSLSNTYAESANNNYFATVNEVNERIRRLLPPRGNSFRHDHHDTCMYIERSKNANVVAYTANLLNKETQQRVESGATGALCECVFDAKTPLRCYWIKLEPEHVARRRARGEMEDMCELNMIERKLAYGCTASPLPLNKLLHELTNVAKNRKNNKNNNNALTSYESSRGANTSGEFTKAFQNCSCTNLNEDSVKDSFSSNHNNNNSSTNHFFHNSEQERQHHHHHHHHKEYSDHHHKSGHSSRENSSFHYNTNYNNNNNSVFSRYSLSMVANNTITNNEKKIAEWHASFQPCVVKFVAMPHRPLLLLLLPPLLSQQTCALDNDYVPVMIGAHNGHIVLVTSIYVKSIEPRHFYQLPSVEYIDIKGYSLQTGEALTHREYA